MKKAREDAALAAASAAAAETRRNSQENTPGFFQKVWMAIKGLFF